jgi:hypothetical protein
MRSQLSILLFISVILSPFAVSASTYHGNISADVGLPAVVMSAPTASPVPGTYSSTQDVVLSTDAAAQEIHFTLDGSVPDCNSQNYYSTPIEASSTVTIAAVSCYLNLSEQRIPSDIATFVYTITSPTANEATTTTATSTSETTTSGNGPIVGTFGVSNGGGGGGGSYAPPQTPPLPQVLGASTSTIPSGTTTVPRVGSGTVAHHIHGLVAPLLKSAATTTATASQTAAAASADGLGFNWWWLLLLLLALFLARWLWKEFKNEEN